MKLQCATLLGVLTVAFGCRAAPITLVDKEPANVEIRGVGNLSCGEFISHRRQNNPAQMDLYVQWTDGFIAAYNVRSNFARKWLRPTSGNLARFPDAQTVLLFIEKHCNEHPLDEVLDATFSLVNDLGGEVIWKKYK